MDGKSAENAGCDAEHQDAADAAEIHLTDRTRKGALVLEAHHGLDGAYLDCLALVAARPRRARGRTRPGSR